MRGEATEDYDVHMDELLGRPSSGQFSVRTKKNDYIKAAADFAATLS